MAETSAIAPTEYRVIIDLGETYQEIDNFGASDCWTMQKIGGWSDENKNKVADLLFSVTKGIGLSCWRFNLGGGINHERIGHPWRTVETFEVGEGEYDWTRQANERWFLRAAKARGVGQYVAFVNSPPARMTRNGFTNCDKGPHTTNLKEGYEGQFARYLADILLHFRDNPDEDERIEFDYISPVNEPNWEWEGRGQEGNRACNRDIKAIALALYDALQSRSLATETMLAESGIYWAMCGPELLSLKYHAKYGGYIDALCGDEDLRGKIAATLSAHAYFIDKPEAIEKARRKLRAKLDQYPAWKYWQTEYCILGEGGGGRDLGMATALRVARTIHCDLTLLNASAWQWWTAMSREDYKDGLVYTDYHNEGDAETIYPSKTLWALGNFSRFIRPGAKRVDLRGANNMAGLLGSAYKNDESGAMLVVLINMAETPAQVSLRFDGAAPGLLTRYVTSDAEGDDLKEGQPVAATRLHVIPARSVVTLVTGPGDRDS